jgi:GT2 family glycosyltransferase
MPEPTPCAVHYLSPVSIVVLTFNRREEVLRTVARLIALPEQPPIVVVDNASTDGSARALIQRFPQVTVVRLPFNIGAAGRNYGVAAVHTPYVAFCDDDTWWEPGAISAAVAILDGHDAVAVVCARVLVGETAREDPASACMAISPLPDEGLPGRTILGFMAGASVIRVSAFRQCGGYCGRLFLGGEEELMALDLAARGWKMRYCEALTVHHHPSISRNARQRRALLARNALWIAVLRLPWRAVARRLLAIRRLRSSRAHVLWQLVHALPWALRERCVIPQQVERMRRCIEMAQSASARWSERAPLAMESAARSHSGDTHVSSH